MKAIYFDMDGTIADLYGVPNWLEKLRNEDASPYQEAKPLVNMEQLNNLCEQLIKHGIVIGVISWLALGSSKSYDKEVRKAKREWIQKHLPCAQEIHLVKYGSTKRKSAKHKDSILVDDNAKVRKGWHGHSTIDATKNILKELQKVLDKVAA